MNRASRFLRAIGSLVFLGAGLFYTLAPPRTTTSFFDTPFPAIAWGAVFVFGGIVSLLGVITRYVHVERFGVFAIVVAGTCLSTGQAFVMFDLPITWTRGGGLLAYVGFTLFAFERWCRLGADERAINAVADAG
ncbi:hypothetical protein [Brevibacterium sp. SMBL_HHYL_HB1]|uniref:hypothetical protein n=1 Tax=Brevibacterium sp. SMBL_HHYL_HB1 TaxID=2777556 RepID=UPI001BA71420|nr:hypothetical protein [Brevibacterium sp. SMBL_HHYL_HB1]QUL79930.1 hypothetical protein IG171_03555 [Brevibacterium sp. SMBL_HHYL_HB1]